MSSNPTLLSDNILNEVRCNVSIFEFDLQLFQNPHTLSDFILLIQLLFLVPELMLHIRLCYWYIQTLMYMKEDVYLSFDHSGHSQLLILPVGITPDSIIYSNAKAYTYTNLLAVGFHLPLSWFSFLSIHIPILFIYNNPDGLF